MYNTGLPADLQYTTHEQFFLQPSVVQFLPKNKSIMKCIFSNSGKQNCLTHVWVSVTVHFFKGLYQQLTTVWGYYASINLL